MSFIRNLLGKWTYKKINKGLLPSDATTSTPKKINLSFNSSVSLLLLHLMNAQAKGTMDSLPHGYSFVVGNNNAQVFLKLVL
jgi:hypothetical protein